MVNQVPGVKDPATPSASAEGPTSIMGQPDDITTHQASEPQHVLHGPQEPVYSEYPDELEIGTDSSDVSRPFHFEIKHTTLTTWYSAAEQS
jgi:hypothetical protein